MLKANSNKTEDLQKVYSGLGAVLPGINSTEKWRLPMPDQSSLIRDSAVNPDYTKRPDPNDMAELLGMLG